MPAASSRRKASSRRQNSEDIEVDRPTQNREEAIEDEAPQRRKKVRAMSDNEESEDETIDVNEFKDQPLPREAHTHLKGLSSDWNETDKLLRQHWSILGTIGAGIADATVGDEDPAEIAELDQIMRQLIDLSAKFASNRDILLNLQQKVAQGEAVDDVLGQYLIGVKEENKKYKEKTSRQKYSKVDEYIEFRSAIWDVRHPGTPMPPLTNFIPKEDGDDSDDDDLEIGGQTQDFKCPITLTLLTDPLTSSVCGHSYSTTGIRESFKGRPQNLPISCPAAGCNKKITLAQCRPNPDLAKRVKAYARRIARQEEDDHSDVDEVIE